MKAEINSELKHLTLALTLVLFGVTLLVPTVNAAQQPYSIPIYGYSWADYTVRVQIDSEPTWAHNEILEAMMIWNRAQIWFKQNYYQTATVYQFIEAQGNQVNVGFTPTLIKVKYGGYTEFTVSGQYFSHVAVTLSLMNEAYVKVIALHELGHALGLDHASYSEDLMNAESIEASLPSTLDLYAVLILATGRASSPVILPKEIPYTVPPSTAVPEFTVTPLILIPVVASALGVARKCKRKS